LDDASPSEGASRESPIQSSEGGDAVCFNVSPFKLRRDYVEKDVELL